MRRRPSLVVLLRLLVAGALAPRRAAPCERRKVPPTTSGSIRRSSARPRPSVEKAYVVINTAGGVQPSQLQAAAGPVVSPQPQPSLSPSRRRPTRKKDEPKQPEPGKGGRSRAGAGPAAHPAAACLWAVRDRKASSASAKARQPGLSALSTGSY